MKYKLFFGIANNQLELTTQMTSFLFICRHIYTLVSLCKFNCLLDNEVWHSSMGTYTAHVLMLFANEKPIQPSVKIYKLV